MDDFSESSSNESVSAQCVGDTGRQSFAPSLLPVSNLALPMGEHFENLFTSGFRCRNTNNVNISPHQDRYLLAPEHTGKSVSARQYSIHHRDHTTHVGKVAPYPNSQPQMPTRHTGRAKTSYWSDSKSFDTNTFTNSCKESRPQSREDVRSVTNDWLHTAQRPQIPQTDYTQNITLHMQDVELWQKYNKLGTEMIISSTKSRRMFPSIRFNVQGLDPRQHYFLWLHFSSPDSPDEQWKWRSESQSWEVQKKKDKRKNNTPETNDTNANFEIYNHPWGAAPGSRWMELPVNLEDLRLTSEPSNTTDVRLMPFKMYIPVVYIAPAMFDARSQQHKMLPMQATYFRLEMQQFICSSAYHNPKMTILKCHTNPKARFRKIN